MSDRSVAAPDEKMAEWMRSVDADLVQLKSRRLQGALSMDSIEAASLAVGATRDAPLRLNGSQAWTADVEYLGATGAKVSGVTGDDALVIRNENGVIRDMFPRQYASLGGGTAQSIAGSTPTVLTLAGCAALSSPYAASATTAAGQLITPTAGVYHLLYYGLWGALADATVRLVAIEMSTNGGASWSTLFNADQSNLNHAGFGQLQTISNPTPLAAGTRLRLNVDQRSAGALNHVPQLFSATFLRGPL